MRKGVSRDVWKNIEFSIRILLEIQKFIHFWKSNSSDCRNCQDFWIFLGNSKNLVKSRMPFIYVPRNHHRRATHLGISKRINLHHRVVSFTERCIWMTDMYNFIKLNLLSCWYFKFSPWAQLHQDFQFQNRKAAWLPSEWTHEQVRVRVPSCDRQQDTREILQSVWVPILSAFLKRWFCCAFINFK